MKESHKPPNGQITDNLLPFLRLSHSFFSKQHTYKHKEQERKEERERGGVERERERGGGVEREREREGGGEEEEEEQCGQLTTCSLACCSLSSKSRSLICALHSS